MILLESVENPILYCAIETKDKACVISVLLMLWIFQQTVCFVH